MKIIISQEFIKYCLVGVVNTIVSMLTAFICLNFLQYNYYLSTALSYLFGIITSFTLNKKFTFKDNNKHVLRQFLKFNITYIPIYVLSFWFLGNNLTYWYFEHFPSTADFCINFINNFLNYSIAKDIFIDDVAVCVSIGVNLFLAFCAVRKFVFTQKME